MEHQDLYSGLIRLHILHHAAEESIFGLGTIEELGRHDTRLALERFTHFCTASKNAGIFNLKKSWKVHAALLGSVTIKSNFPAGVVQRSIKIQ